MSLRFVLCFIFREKYSLRYLAKYHLKVVFIEDIPGLSVEKAFREDHKADPSNWQFGELYKMHIAKYFTVVRNVLGSSLVLGSKKKLKSSGKAPVRYYGKNTRLPKDSSKDLVVDLSQFVKAKEKPVSKSWGENFIEIKSNESEQTGPSAESNKAYNPLGIYDKATESYLKGKMAEAASEKQDQSESMTSAWLKLQQKVSYYNKHLHENPGDVKMWLEFIDFQEEAVMLHEDQGSKERQKTRDALVQDIKESVMEKAIQKNPASLELQLAQLKLCNLSWESARIRKAWKQLTFHHPNDPNVWWLYLEHIRSTFTSFTVTAMCKAYGKCVSVLWEFLTGKILSHPTLPHTQQHILGKLL